jgi:tetrahydromethanopterin S-methyltransferase subunit A
MEAFKKVVEKRQEIIRQNKIDKKQEASKFLLEHEATTKPKPKPTKTVNVVNSESDDDSQPEIIIKKIPKKKKKPIIINVEESSESEEEEEVKQPKQTTKEVPQPTRQLVSQQNKKSLFQMVPTKNYFAD